MPKANWGISARDVDDFDRSTLYKPYDGPTPPLGVYQWVIKTLKTAPKTGDKLPQLRVGLELIPRPGFNEDKYEGFWIMDFIPISDKTKFRYIPFLDAIGVSGRDFTQRTLTDEEGKVRKIGAWKNTGEEIISAQLKMGEDQNGNDQLQIGTYMEPRDYDMDDEDAEYDEDAEDDDYDFDDDDENDYEDDDE